LFYDTIRDAIRGASPEEEKENLQWEGFAENGFFKPGMKK